MLSELYGLGWNHSGECGMIDSGNGFYLLLQHSDYPSVNLDVTVSLVEIPAITIVSLTDTGGVIEHEWQDEEIDVQDITSMAEEAMQLNEGE